MSEGKANPTPVKKQSCEICEVETQWVSFRGEEEWCEECGHSKTMFEPENAPGGCPAHPEATHESGFGLAGGGYGAYSICNECGAIFGKVQEA